MRDKFWNFVFYKFIFVFGVLNVQEMNEMMGWCIWFSFLGTLLITEQLCKDRFQLVSFPPAQLAVYCFMFPPLSSYLLPPPVVLLP